MAWPWGEWKADAGNWMSSVGPMNAAAAGVFMEG